MNCGTPVNYSQRKKKQICSDSIRFLFPFSIKILLVHKGKIVRVPLPFQNFLFCLPTNKQEYEVEISQIIGRQTISPYGPGKTIYLLFIALRY